MHNHISIYRITKIVIYLALLWIYDITILKLIVVIRTTKSNSNRKTI